MARMNTAVVETPQKTHEGAVASRINATMELRRSVLSTMLFEDTFYEKGSSIAARIAELVPKVEPETVAALAVEAREQMYLRHVPLFLVRELARIKGTGTLVADTLTRVIQRPDELGEYLAMYWGAGKASGTTKRPEPLSAGSKRGLARAFAKFNEYSLAKYDQDGAVKLKDVLRLTHVKPSNTEQGALWKKVITRTLDTPDTWEVALSSGADKKETFERLLRDRKLGGLAFLRNLRNMIESKVDSALVRERFNGNFDKVLPFRFIAAANHAATYADRINDAMLRACAGMEKLTGKTAVLVDISGSMDCAISGKSDLQRVDAAAALAVLVRELAEECRVFSFSTDLKEVQNYRGLPLADAIKNSQPHGGTEMGMSVRRACALDKFDRVIVITDEQSRDNVSAPVGTAGYVINVAGYKRGVGYGKWTHVDGWSEKILDFIRVVEAEGVTAQ
jgi:60 kDa SS-A/Ro ribonucleoprotein